MKKYFKIMVFSVVIISIFFAPLNSVAQAKNNDMQYNNKIFTKKEYKKTVMIDFNGMRTRDKKVIKKVYALLAKMKLKEANQNEPIKVGFVYLILHMKNGSKKRVSFVNSQMNTTSKKYIIVKNDPLDKIRKIFESKKIKNN
ncbi:MAG: hypothetical protein HFH73_08285 [Lachnospiraceae bacterium]|jgi:hypothetical protein|nr:hypothetical protein [Lachnospiraceae bacterium]